MSDLSTSEQNNHENEKVLVTMSGFFENSIVLDIQNSSDTSRLTYSSEITFPLDCSTNKKSDDSENVNQQLSEQTFVAIIIDEVESQEPYKICELNKEPWIPQFTSNQKNFISHGVSDISCTPMIFLNQQYNIDGFTNDTHVAPRYTQIFDTFFDNQDIHHESHLVDYSRKCDDQEKSLPIATNHDNDTCVLKLPYKCGGCEKSFLTKYDLAVHNRTHTGERPYKCERCDKSFAQKNNLTTHTRVHTNVRPYKCESCDKSFTQKCALTRHARTHTNDRPYKCNYCDKSFAQKGNLTAHIRTHTKECNYKCKYCEKSFTRKNYLVMHTRVHHQHKNDC